MARKPLKPCYINSCPGLVEPGVKYCAAHAHLEAEEYREKMRAFDASRLGASARGYDAKWARLQKFYIRQNPLCEICSKPAELVHHIEEIAQGGARLDQDNLQSLCQPCHRRAHR